MKEIIIICLIFLGISILIQHCDSKRDPYEEGMHWNYSIKCENGFVYKSLGDRQGIIQVLNSDGTPLKCGQKIK